MKIRAAEIILYVADQQLSRNFYMEMLGMQPALDVPGMTEFVLSENCKLGLMPNSGIAKILMPFMPNPDLGTGIPRCELYMKVDDLSLVMRTAAIAGALVISDPQPRDWGDTVCYVADPDGHILAFAKKIV